MRLILVIALIFIVFDVNCQNRRPKNDLWNNVSLQVKAGPSMVVTELERDLSGFVNEMRHVPGPAVSVGISKLINPRFEIGYELEYSSFNGFQNNPDFSAYKYGHYKISLMNLEPVAYHSYVRNHNATITFHLDPREKKRTIPFAYIKGGSTRIFSTLMYKDDKEVIFTKTGRDETKPNSSIYVDNYNFGIGIGNELIVNEIMSLSILYDMTYLNDDNLDAVHNFREPPPAGYKNFVSGIYTRVQVSMSYNLNPDRQRIAVRKFLLKDSFNKKRKKKVMYPWYKR